MPWSHDRLGASVPFRYHVKRKLACRSLRLSVGRRMTSRSTDEPYRVGLLRVHSTFCIQRVSASARRAPIQYFIFSLGWDRSRTFAVGERRSKANPAVGDFERKAEPSGEGAKR